MNLDLDTLGLTQEKLTDLVVNQLADTILDYNDGGYSETLYHATKNRIQEAVDKQIETIANEHITPRVAEITDTMTLQATNEWGEKKGEALTFREYLVQRAEAYMSEPVNYQGKTKQEAGGYSWSKSTSRMSYLVDKHLQYEIERAMKDALKEANHTMAQGLHEACRHAINEVAQDFTIKVGKS